MLEIGISTASFFSKSQTEDTLLLLQKYRIPVVEVFLTTFCEYEKDFVDELKRRKGNLNVYSVHTLNQQFEPELFNGWQRTRGDAEVFFRKICYAMQALDANYYTFHGPARLKRTPYNVNFERFGRRLDELDAIINEYKKGGRIVYENVHWTYFSYPEFFNEIKPFTDVRTCLDIKQAMQSKFSAYDYIDVMGDRLKNVHLCDYDKDGKLKACGDGIVDFVELFRYLMRKGYDGPLMMEIYPETYGDVSEAFKSYEYLSECLIKAKTLED